MYDEPSAEGFEDINQNNQIQIKQTYEVFSKLQFVTLKKYIKVIHYYV